MKIKESLCNNVELLELEYGDVFKWGKFVLMKVNPIIFDENLGDIAVIFLDTGRLDVMSKYTLVEKLDNAELVTN